MDNFKQKLIGVLALLSIAMGALAFVFFGIYKELRTGTTLFQRSLDSTDAEKKRQFLRPASREDVMRHSINSAKAELDSFLVGDTANREFHRTNYYSNLSTIDSLIVNDPARKDDTNSDYIEIP